MNTKDLTRLWLGTTMLVLVGIAALPASAAPTRDGAAEKYFEDASRQLGGGNVGAAIIQLRNALQRDPDFAEARELLGELSATQGDLATAEKELRRALDLRRSTRTELSLGRVLLRLGKMEDVLTVVGDSGEDKATQAEMLTLRGRALLGLRRADEAEPLLLRAESLAARADTRYELARIAFSRGRHDEATKLANAALEQDRSFGEAWLLRGDLLVQAGDTAGALAVLKEGMEASPSDVRLPLGRATLLLQAGRAGEAEADVQRAATLAPKLPATVLLQAAMALNKGNAEEADRLYTGIESRAADHPEGQLIGGLIKMQRGQSVQAELLLSRFVAANPQRADIRRALAGIRLQLGNYLGATELLTALSEESPEDIGLTRQLASAYLRAGELEKASAQFRKLASHPGGIGAEARSMLPVLGVDTGALADGGQPNAAPAGEALVVADLLSARETDKALVKARDLSKAYPKDPAVICLLGNALQAKGDVPGAVSAYRQALDVAPDFLPAVENLVRAHLRQGKPDDAEAVLRERVAANPASEPLVQRYAQFLAEANRRTEAIALLEDAAKRTKSRDLSMLLAAQYTVTKRPAEAVATLDRMLGWHPQDAAAHQMAVRGLVEANAAPRAAEVLKAWMAFDGSARPRIVLGRVLASQKRFDEARALLEEARRIDPGNLEAAQALTGVAVVTGKPDAGIAIARSLKATQPAAAAGLEAEVLVRTGKPTEAVALLSAALAEHPDPRLVLARLSVRRTTNDLGLGTKELADWVAGHPGDVPVRAAYAELLSQQSDHQGAAAQYRHLARVVPDSPAYLNNLAWSQFMLGEEGALTTARRALALAPRSAEVADTVGWILVKTGKGKEGLEVLRHAAALAPQSSTVQYHLAAALDLAGERAEARSILAAVVASGAPFAEKADAQALLASLSR